MKIAIPTEKGMVSAHFGRCPEFTIVEISDGKAGEIKVVANPGHEPGKIPVFLKNMDVSAIITGGMGRRAIELFEQMGIKYYLGITGKVDDVIRDFPEGKIKSGESLCSPQHLGERHGANCSHEHHGGVR